MNEIKLLILDIDSMFYHAHRETSLEESIEAFKEKLNNCLTKSGCTHYCAFTGRGKVFRHKIDPEYKSGRKYTMKYFKALKEWAIVEYNINVCEEYEADDAVVYWYNQDLIYGKFAINSEEKCITWRNNAYNQDSQEITKIISSYDKDILNSIPGKHFNYGYKLEDKNDPDSVIKGWWHTTSENEASSFKAMQLIVGDSGDNIKALVGKGIKYFEKIAPNIQNFEDILYEYTSLYGLSKGIYEFQKNYRLLHMLENDEDFKREVGKLPNFPVINEIEQKKLNVESIPEF